MIQLQFLNKILEEKDSSLITINNLTDEFFSDYKDEFNFIKNHLLKYKNIPDRETFLNVFPKFDIIEVKESNKYLLDSLYEDRNKKLLASTFNKVRTALLNDDTDKAIKIYNEDIEKLSSAKHLESIDLIEDLSRYDNYVKKTTNFTKFYTKTGFPELDEVIGGWDRKEELTTIVARPGVGKSWLLLKIAIAAAQQGLRVGIYSGEMSEDKVGYRIDTLISHISNTKIIRGNEDVMVDYKKYLESIKDTITGTIKVLTPTSINGIPGVSALRAFIEKDNLDMLCVDQYSLLEDDRKAKSQTDQTSNIAKDLKALQVLKQIPIIAISQQNRENVENGVSASNVALSDKIGQYATILLFLEQKDNILTIYLGKARDSRNGKTLKYLIDLDKGMFTYIPEDEDATNGAHVEELKKEYELDEGEQPF
jgi:replicative DNA helicase